MPRNISKQKLNVSTSSYQFEDIDLEMAVKSLELRDREIVTLYLMGHRHKDIAEVFNLERSMITKRLGIIVNILSTKMNPHKTNTTNEVIDNNDCL